MYETYFQLRENPFVLAPDPAYLFLTERHREALAGLTYAILRRKGFVVLTGDAGTGKTTLLRVILSSIPARSAHCSFVLNPLLTPSEFLELAMLDFGLSDLPVSKALRLVKLQDFLIREHAEGRSAVLIVDEAHKLSPEVLEEIRLLTNFETIHGKMLQIVLAGQNEFNEVLNRHSLRQLKQRIAVRLSIDPLAGAEVEQYIRHRWKQAGGVSDLPFRADAIQRITSWSEGIPRVINSICDNALLLAYGAGLTSIGASEILEVVTDLDLSPPSGVAPARPEPAALPAPVGEAFQPHSLAALECSPQNLPTVPVHSHGLMDWPEMPRIDHEQDI